MTLCPCGSAKELEDCCGPIIGGFPAPTPEALMRSRYAAFALGKLEYIDHSQTNELRAEADQSDGGSNVDDITWLGLNVISASESDDEGRVEFSVRFRRDGQEFAGHEVSSFRRVDGRWLYAAGDLDVKPIPHQSSKVGRNDPCSCGSGKKYKKCCGA
jgi:SEC-C motif-containing protein